MHVELHACVAHAHERQRLRIPCVHRFTPNGNRNAIEVTEGRTRRATVFPCRLRVRSPNLYGCSPLCDRRSNVHTTRFAPVGTAEHFGGQLLTDEFSPGFYGARIRQRFLSITVSGTCTSSKLYRGPAWTRPLVSRIPYRFIRPQLQCCYFATPGIDVARISWVVCAVIRWPDAARYLGKSGCVSRARQRRS
ncbi:hypothetical protein QFZ97_005512 [Paraburkholderia youngii]